MNRDLAKGDYTVKGEHQQQGIRSRCASIQKSLAFNTGYIPVNPNKMELPRGLWISIKKVEEEEKDRIRLVTDYGVIDVVLRYVKCRKSSYPKIIFYVFFLKNH